MHLSKHAGLIPKSIPFVKSESKIFFFKGKELLVFHHTYIDIVAPQKKRTHFKKCPWSFRNLPISINSVLIFGHVTLVRGKYYIYSYE